MSLDRVPVCATAARFALDLAVVDTCTRECVALDVRTTFRGQHVADVLTRVGVRRGLASVITTDNGTEFTSRALDHWAYRNGLKLDFTRPGKPTDNGHIESFNARLRSECSTTSRRSRRLGR